MYSYVRTYSGEMNGGGGRRIPSILRVFCAYDHGKLEPFPSFCFEDGNKVDLLLF